MVAERRDDGPRLSVARPLAVVDVDEVARIEAALGRLADERRRLLREPRSFMRGAGEARRQVAALDERIAGLWQQKRQALADQTVIAARARRREAWGLDGWV